MIKVKKRKILLLQGDGIGPEVIVEVKKIINWFNDKNSVLVALSGGVDSALVAYSAYVKLGKSAIAVIADYKTLAQEELEFAKKISSEIGIKHIVI